MVTLQELDYCVRKFHRKSPGTDVTKVLEAVERMVLELEKEGPRDSGTAVRGTEEVLPARAHPVGTGAQGSWF